MDKPNVVKKKDMRTTMRYLSCFLGFGLLIITSQTVHIFLTGLVSVSSTSSDLLIAQGYDSEDTSVGDSSPPRGSDRRDS